METAKCLETVPTCRRGTSTQTYCVLEAGGIEPPSEGGPPGIGYMLSFCFVLASCGSHKQDPPKPASLVSAAHPPAMVKLPSPIFGALANPTGSGW